MSRIGQPNPPGRARRAASVTLRDGAVSEAQAARAHSMAELMDPANRSLADALRIAYAMLLGAIAVMFVLFLVSGFQQINAAEVGVRVTAGKIAAKDLKQGLHMSWPQPFGDILKVQTNDQPLDVKKAFFPNLTQPEEDGLKLKGVQSLAEGGRESLDPESDGALLTADGFMVHVRWNISYQRSDDARSLIAIAEEPAHIEPVERRIVMAAARRGIIHAAATMTADEVLYDQSTRKDFRPVSDVARDKAQKILDEMDLGITFKQFNRAEKLPPRNVMKEFNSVQTAQSDADAARSGAELDARKKLSETAGEAAPVILAQIDRYDGQLAAGKTAEAERTLATIHDLMLRRTVTIDGREVLASVSGEVSRKLAEASQYATGVVQRAQGDARSYAAKLDAFQANPQVFLSGEWTDAYKIFAGRESVQMMYLPPGLERLVLTINRDPEIERDIKTREQERIAEEAIRERDKKRARDVYERSLEGTSPEGG